MNLKELREKQGLTQLALAAASGVNQSTLSQYESGVRKPSLENAKRLAKALHITLDELVTHLSSPKEEE